MTRLRRAALIFGALAVITASVGLMGDRQKEVRAGDVETDKAKKILGSMTLEEKIGQMFVTWFEGPVASDSVRKMLLQYHLGGVIYFSWANNVQNPAQIAELSNGLQRIAMDKYRVPIPLFISTDQEGGVVARVVEPAAVFPGNMALGATRSRELARKAANVTAVELSRLGINMNLAPVLDVNTNPSNPVIGVRSYSEDPREVAALGTVQIAEHRRHHVLATVKHFPGHGDTAVDSHSGLPVVQKDRASLEEVELAPFREAIRAGVDAIMTAHIVVPELDSSWRPATLSREILGGVLRQELGFQGLIASDSLGMAGVRQQFGDDRVPVEAVLAGVDILLKPPDLEVAYQSLLAAVRSGEIPETRIDESVLRILKLKLRYGLFDQPYVDTDTLLEVGSDDHLEVVRTVARQSITLLRNDDHLLPLQRNRLPNVLVVGVPETSPYQVGGLLQQRDFDVTVVQTATRPSSSDVSRATAAAKSADVIVALSHSAWKSREQIALLQRLIDTERPTVLLMLRDPYDAASVTGAAAVLAAYGNRSSSLEAAMEVIVGEVRPTGRLPVTVPGAYPYGHGLSF